MVRLEKIFYEKLFHTKALGKQRIIGKPSKWYAEYPKRTEMIMS